MGIVTPWTGKSMTFGDLVIGVDYDKDGLIIGCGMNGVKKATITDLVRGIEWFEAVLGVPTIAETRKAVMRGSLQALQTELSSRTFTQQR